MSQMLLLLWKVSSQFVAICLEDLSPVTNILFNFPHLSLREVVDPASWQKIGFQLFAEEQEEEEGDESQHQDN